MYVDWMLEKAIDCSKVNAQTASLLRSKMNKCKSLVYVSTPNISHSKWCPWELGYVDGYRNGRCAVLPIIKTGQEFSNVPDYLGLYPYIDYAPGNNSDKYDFWVNDPYDKNKYVRLRDWLDGTDLN